MLQHLLSRRLVMFTGKGGVGKSSCALAFAAGAARLGNRVLLAELTARSASSAILEAPPATHEPQRPRPQMYPTLWTARLDPVASLQEYLKDQLRSERLVRLATETKALARLWDAAPSVTEFSWLNTLYHHEKAEREAGGKVWDLVVVDLPATGHAVTLLGVPHGTLGMITVGSLASRARQIETLLQDGMRTALCVVTLPEELGINETKELVVELRERNALRVEHVVVNGLLPALGDVTDLQLDARGLSTDEQRAMLVWRERRQRRLQQQRRLDELRQFLAEQQLPCSLLEHVVERGLVRVNRMAAALMGEAP